VSFEWLNLLEVSDLTGDVDQGGWSASLTFFCSQADAPYLRQITLYHRNFSGLSWEIADRVGLTGVIIPQSVKADRGVSRVQAMAYSYHKPLDSIPVTGCYFEDSNAGVHAHQINNLSLALVVEHLALHHVHINGDGDIDTTLVDTAGSTGVDPYIVRENASIWRALQKIAADEFYSIYFNRENQLVYEPHPQFDATLPDVVASLDSTNLLAPYTVELREGRKAKNVVLLGLTNAGEVIESTYPAGVGVDVRGPRREVRCNAQARLDVLAERWYKWLTRDYTATVLLPGAWDIELNDRIALTLSGTTSNGVTFSWSDKDFWVSRVSYRKRGTSSFGYNTELVLEEGYTA
jgi:hypothetical protein